jgi:dolichol-phosphate mannosyltransferase
VLAGLELRDVLGYHGAINEEGLGVWVALQSAGASVHDYPKFKLVVNRIVNTGIRMLFYSGYDDTTNVFKAHRRDVIKTVQPLSNHVNFTVQIPLKGDHALAQLQGHPSWRNRRDGESKLSLQEPVSRYAFIVLHVLFQQHVSRGDYYMRLVGQTVAPNVTSLRSHIVRR